MEQHRESYRYWAFLSYSHADERWARWLHRSLETYAVPRHLRGRASAFGPLPERLYPVFRDREELPGAPELGVVIDAALQVSRYQIVICSPRAAASRWVNEEILRFKSLGRKDRILALIVDGEPNARDPARECFPPALRAGGADVIEPLAADLRPAGDGRHGALMKLLSGLLGVGLDELRRRDRQRRREQALLTGLCAAALAGGVYGLLQLQAHQHETEQRQIQAQRWVKEGRSSLEQGELLQAGAYFAAALKAGHEGPGLRYQLGQALLPLRAQQDWRAEHGTALNRIAISEDGERIASFGGGIGRIWDAEGRLLGELKDVPPRPAHPRFAPGGRRLASLGSDIPEQPRARQTYIWDVETGARLARIEGNLWPGAVRPFDPSGERIAVIRQVFRGDELDLTLAVHDTASGQLLLNIEADRKVTMPSFSLDGKRLLSASEGKGTIRLWDAATGRALLSFEPRPAASTAAYFSPDDQRILSMAETGALRVWETRDGAFADAPGAHDSFAPAISHSRDGRYWVTEGGDGFRVWDLVSSRQLLEGREADPYQMKSRLSADGEWLLTVDSRQSAWLWSLAQGRPGLVLEGGGEGVVEALFDPTHGRVITAHAHGELRAWSLDALRQPLRVMRHDAPLDANNLPTVSAAAFSPDGETVATGGEDGVLRLWRGQDVPRVLRGHRAVIRHLAWMGPDELLSVAADGELRRWEVSSGRLLASQTLDSQGIVAAQTSLDGRRLLLKTNKAHALHDTAQGQRLAVLPADESLLRFDAQSAEVLGADAQGQLLRWSAETGEALPSVPAHAAGIEALATRADGLWASAGTDQQVHLRSSPNAAPQWTLDLATRAPEIGVPQRLALDAQASRLAIAGRSGRIALWDWQHERLRMLAPQAVEVTALAFSPDGVLLVSAGEDGSVEVWDVASGERLWRWPAHRLAVSELHFSADGRQLLTRSERDNAAKRWQLTPETLPRAALLAELDCRLPWVVTAAGARRQAPPPCE